MALRHVGLVRARAHIGGQVLKIPCLPSDRLEGRTNASSNSCDKAVTHSGRRHRKAELRAKEGPGRHKQPLKANQTAVESLHGSKLSWPLRVQKAFYTMATCCVKCLGPV